MGVRVAWAAAGAAYVIVIGLLSRPLTFFWDEWSILWAGLDSPGWGLLQENNGNFFPLGRLAFLLETRVFGTWYPGYAMVTAALAVVCTAVLAHLLDTGDRLRRAMIAAASAVFLGSSGVLFAIGVGFMSNWLLALLLALAAAWVLRDHTQWSRVAVGLVLVALCGLTMTSTAIPLALLVCALILDPTAGRARDLAVPAGRRWLVCVLTLAVGVVLAGVGIVGAGAFPSIDPASGSNDGLASSALSMGVVDLTSTAVAAVSAWLGSPLLYKPMVDPLWTARVFYGVLQHRAILVVAGLALVALVVLAVRVTLQRTSPGARSGRLAAVTSFAGPAGLYLAPIMGLVAIVLIARPDGFFIVRYVTVWALPAAVFWVTLVTRPAVRPIRILQAVPAVLLVISGVACLVTLPSTFQRMANLEAPRLDLGAAQAAALARCGEGTPELVRELAPTIPADVACRIHEDLVDHSLLGLLGAAR